MSFQLKIDLRQQSAALLIGRARDAIIKAFINEKKQAGLTQEQVAKKLGVNRSHINRILKGEANLTLRTISDIAWVLGYDVSIALNKSGPLRGENDVPGHTIKASNVIGWPKPTVNVSTYAVAAE